MDTPPATVESARLRISGTWSGVLEVNLSSWTLQMLIADVATRSGHAGLPECISLISGGRVLKDDSGVKSLGALGLKNNSRLLATVVSADRGKALNDEAEAQALREKKLARIRDAAAALAARHSDGSLPDEDYNIELENQNGKTLKFQTETDQKGLMMGLMLHNKAKRFIKKKMYKDALDVLCIAEDSFSLCDPKVTEMIDNVPILHLDKVWCYFMLRDISCLSLAGEHLMKARKGFEQSHGKDSARLRLLRAGRQAEVALYLRLELLEGVVAYHTGKFEASRRAISSAQAKYNLLDVSSDALAMLMGMGYKERKAKRALRLTGQDISAAVNFLVEEREQEAQRRKENLQRQEEILEQKTYGKTPQNKAVDIQAVQKLSSLGFEKPLVAEALRLNENDMQKALDLLTNPDENCNLQVHLEDRKKRKAMELTTQVVEQLISIGYDMGQVMDAVNSSSTKAEVLQALVAGSGDGRRQADNNSTAAHDMEGSSEGHEQGGDKDMEHELTREISGDALADYDIDVTNEGEAIQEYLLLLDSVSCAARMTS